MKCWYICTDLMFSSRVMGLAQQLGVDLQTTGPTLPEDIAIAPPDLVLIDLATPGLNITELVPHIRAAAKSARLLAYGPHVHEAKLAAAQAAGCDEVLTRGQFDRQMEAILSAG